MTRAAHAPAPLTARELEIAGLIGQGLGRRQVAELLFISMRTVDAHLQHIYAKTGTRSQITLINWLAENAPLADPRAVTNIDGTNPPITHDYSKKNGTPPMTTLTQAPHDTIHINRAAVITTRMPTADECASGFPDGAPVLVVADGGPEKVFPYWVMLTCDDPHGQPEPGVFQDAAAYVLDVIAEELELVTGRYNDLAEALRRSPCNVPHLADRIRAERAADWLDSDATLHEIATLAGSATSSTTAGATGCRD